jgi:glycosyltransferase involved in cell wall biosynthesis/ADP-heptose:LPS heptosyltransferase
MSRFLSLLIRRFQSFKSERRLLKTFDDWKRKLPSAASVSHTEKKLLVIRLDDIGDYLLFRNFLGAYKASEKWKGYSVHLLANQAWKELFEAFDRDQVDEVQFVDKKKYLAEEDYRLGIWEGLNEKGFDAVICPSCTRPLLLDDLCALATGAASRIGSQNTFRHHSWNSLSDSLYTSLYQPEDPFIHEFLFNRFFANWSCDLNYQIDYPDLPFQEKRLVDGEYILCFIGAATNSRRWPAPNWIDFIHLVKQRHPEWKLVISGGAAEESMGAEICQATGALQFAGRVSMLETVNLLSNSLAVVSNNTMAAHLSASLHKPTVIVTNGDNYLRFTEYERAGLNGVRTIYPEVFNKWRKRHGDWSLHYTAVTADISGIQPKTVFSVLEEFREKIMPAVQISLPLVSVVLATYNGEKYLSDQLDSVIAQTYPNWEIICVDDGSRDATVSILEEYAARYPNIRIQANLSNLGYIRNFDLGCSLAKGEFIALCDQDDRWHPEKIQAEMEAIGDHPMAYCDSYICNETLEERKGLISEKVHYANIENCIQVAAFCRLYGHALLFRKSLYDSARPFLSCIPHDWWLAFQATLKGSVVYVNRPLVFYRQHSSNVFGAVGGRSRKDRQESLKERNRREISQIRERVEIFYTSCHPEMKEEKEILKSMMKCYRDFSLRNDFLRMFFFFRHMKSLLFVKKYSYMRRVLFCLKMFYKVK